MTITHILTCGNFLHSLTHTYIHHDDIHGTCYVYRLYMVNLNGYVIGGTV